MGPRALAARSRARWTALHVAFTAKPRRHCKWLSASWPPWR